MCVWIGVCEGCGARGWGSGGSGAAEGFLSPIIFTPFCSRRGFGDLQLQAATPHRIKVALGDAKTTF